MPTTTTLMREIEVKTAQFNDALKAAQEASGDDADRLIQECQERNDELSGLNQKHETLTALEVKAADAARLMDEWNAPDRQVPFSAEGSNGGANGGGANGGGTPGLGSIKMLNGEQIAELTQHSIKSFDGQTTKTLGDLVVESEAYKQFTTKTTNSRVEEFNDFYFDGVKATLDTAGLTSIGRVPGIVQLGVQRLFVSDMIPKTPTTDRTLRYLKENSFTNAATTVAEGAAKPEADFDLVEADADVQKIAVWAKITDEMFADFPQVRDYINNRLDYMVRAREEAQILSGNGTAPNLRGILNTSGIQTQAKGTDPVPDAIYKAMTKVRAVGFFEPDMVVLHPYDWQDIRLLRTADDRYIWGPPSEAGPERVWGKPVVITTSIAENTGLVGAFRIGARLFPREGMTVAITNTDQDDFIKNLVTIRVELREALAVPLPLSFCQVTSI